LRREFLCAPKRWDAFLVSAHRQSAIFAQLKQNSATIIKEPEAVFWGGYSGFFSDPDGHRWEVAYNPFWTVREDGRISLSGR